jgi:ribosomal protein S18 acetylase RimI-like enzyme
VGGRVIQGFFVGGAMRPLTLQRAAADRRPTARGPGAPPSAFVGGAAPLQPRTTAGRPAPAHHGQAQVAQRHGDAGSFAIDAAAVGLARTGGKALPQAVLAKMEAAFGADFSAVRVHVGPQASRIGAIAFTTGNDLYFAPGQYQPESIKGQQLIGHELAHVVQQRQGRVRAPGSGVAVVQDPALEAEADRLGMQAAAHRVPIQAKMAGPARGEAPVHISVPGSNAPGSHRLTAGSGAKPIGSLVVHTRRGPAAEVTDLGVDARFRDQGIGRQLLVSAARAGLRSGNSKLSLAAQDNGSGRLTRWYKDLGFHQVGVNNRGMPMLETPISRLLGAAVQCRASGTIQRAMAVNQATEPGQATFLTAYNVTSSVQLCENLASTVGAHSEDRLIDQILPAAAAAGNLVAGVRNEIHIGINRSPCTSTDHLNNGCPSSTKAVGCAERLINLVNNGILYMGTLYTFRLVIQARGLYGSNSDERANSSEAIQAMQNTGFIDFGTQRTATSTRYMDTTTAKKMI